MKQLKVMTKMASQKVRVFFELCEILVECYAIRLRSFRKDLTLFKGSLKRLNVEALVPRDFPSQIHCIEPLF